MSQTSTGTVAPFPPLPGQPFPPARNHPRWKEIYRLHDEWIMKYWPFKNEKKKARIPFMNLAGFSTWCAPAADFKRMVWGARIAGVFFLADDLIDSGKMLDRIPGFKQAATGQGALNVADRAELCHDVVFRAIKATCHPRTFQQLTKCTHEWWNSNIHEPYKNLDQYLAIRRVNIAMYFAHAYFRYTLDLNLTDAQVEHPLMREAEGIVADHVGLTNDYFSYAKEKMSNSDDTNILRILQDHEGLTYFEATELVKQKIRQKEMDFIPAGVAVLNDPELGQNTEVHRWISCLPYCMGGNLAWSQESGRYNVGRLPNGIGFPSLSYNLEATLSNELVDDANETALRNNVFDVGEVPPPDFSIDVDPIETRVLSLSRMHPPARAQAQGAGILAIDTYTALLPVREGDSQEVIDIALEVSIAAVRSLILKFEVNLATIGRFDFVPDNIFCSTTGANLALRVGQIFPSDLEVIESGNGSIIALLNAVNWIEGRSWDGCNSIICAVEQTENSITAVAMMVGPNAPVVIEPIRGRFFGHLERSATPSEFFNFYLKALDATYSSYKTNVSKCMPSALSAEDSWWDPDGPMVSSSEFDFMVYDRQDLSEIAHARVLFNDYLSRPWTREFETIPSFVQNLPSDAPFISESQVAEIFLRFSESDHHNRVAPAVDLTTTYPFIGLISLLKRIPSYELFEKRIATFTCTPQATSFFCVLRVQGDTDTLTRGL